MEDKSRSLLEKIKHTLEKIKISDTSAFYNDLKTNIEALSVYQSELELQNLKLAETVTKLQKQNNRYLNLFYNAPLAYIIVNSSNVIKYINQAACSMLGCISEEVIDTPFTRFIHPEFQDSYNPYIKNLVENNETHSCEIKLVSLPGNKCFFARINGPQQLLAEDEEPAYLLALTNITQQKETEEKLAEESLKVKNSEKLLNEMGKIAKIGGWELDCTTMQQVWTDETYTIHDREKGVYNPNSTEELSRFEPGSKEIIEKAFEAAFTNGKPYDLELEMTTIRGNRKWVRAVCNPLLINGKVSKLTGTLQDITERKLADKEKHEIDILFQTLIEKSSEAITIVNENGYAVYASPTAIVMLGYSAEELCKVRFSEILHPDDIESIEAVFIEVMQAPGKEVKLLGRLRRKSGEFIWCEGIATNWFHNPVINGIVVNFRDVSKREKSEETIRISLTKYKTLFENFPMGITVSDRNGNIIETNATAERLLGISAEEQKNRQLNGNEWQIVRADGSPMPVEEYASVRALKDDTKVENVEMGIKKPNESVTWLNVTAAPIPLEEYGVVVAYNDISGRKQAEEKVLETQENYKNIFENNPLPMWVYDLETLSFMAINDAALVKYGYTREEFLKMTILDIRPKEDQTRLIRNIALVTEGLDEAGYWQHIKKNGDIIDVEITSHTLSYFGRKAELVVANDITERKKAERKLLESEERYRKLAENFPDTTISFFNRDLVVTFVTGQELFNTGKTANDFIGKRFDELLIPSLISLANKSYNDAFNGRINSFEAISFNDRYIRVIALPLVESDGTINEIQVISQNITEQKKSEEKLHESLEREQFLGNLIRNASIAVGVGFPDGRLGMCNLAFQKLTGYSEEDLKNIAWNTLLTPPEWLEKELIFLTELDRTKQPVTYEKEYLHKSGKRIPIELFVHPFFDSEGNVTHYYAFITDITERKKAEENIRKSEHILRLFVEHSPAAIAMFDSEMRYIVHSKRYLTDYRLTDKDLTGRSHYEVFPEMDDNRKAIHRRCLSGEIIKCEEDPLPRIDGKLDFVRYELRPWYEDGTSIGGLIFFSEVITERKMALAALEENERRLRKILETTSDGFWIVDFNRNFIEVNESYCKMSGYSREELLDMKISDLEAIETTMDTNVRILKIRKTGGDRFETVHRRKDGTLFDVEVSVNMLDQEQELMICFCRDITDRKNAEKQLRESETRFSTIFLDSPVAIAISRLKDSKVIHVNRAIINLLGYLSEEILGKTTTQLGIWGNLNDRERFVKILSKNQRIEGLETILIKKTGERRQVLLWGELIQLNGEPCMMAEIIDISERKKAEQQLRERETELNNAQELAQMASWRVDLTNYQLSVSKNYKRLIGLEDETIDVTFDYFISRVHPDDVHLMNLDNYQLTPESLPVSSDFRIRMPDGSVKWFQNSMVGEFAEGKLIALKGTNIDITEKKKREEEIRSQNEKLSAILNSLPDKLFVHDEKGNFLEAYTTNPNGYIVPFDQFLGKNLSDIFPKEVADLNLKYLKECLNKKKLITHEFSTDYKGTYASFEVRVVPFMNDKAIRFVRDITQSKENEKQIIKLNKAIEQSPVAIVITDMNANVTYASRAFEEITGYTKDEIIGKNTRLLKSDKNNTQLYTDMWNTIKSGEIWKGELINKKKDGTLYWEALSITPLYENSSQITGYLAVKQDITDKKNREQEILDLNASLERKVAERTSELRDLYNNAPCGYHSLDSNGVFEMVNNTELEWLGYTREELIGKINAFNILSNKSREIFANNFPLLKKHGKVDDLELDFIRKDGSIISVLLNATAIFDKQGNFVRSRSTIIDHTQRKKAEEALKEALQNLEAANKELEAFSYSVSHDLRAPLRAIGGFTRILIEDYSNRFDDEGKRICDVIMSSSEKMGKLIDDLLAFSRFGRLEMSLSQLNMEPLIRSVIQELTTPKSMERIDITIEPLPDVWVDATLMKQVWMNLISNAIKYSSRKEKATIEISPVLSEGEVIFKIKDNGSGFEMQYVDKLFGVFQRLHKESEFEGTGVGLAIVKRIISRHGGRVWAESKLNEGAIFYFSLPKCD